MKPVLLLILACSAVNGATLRYWVEPCSDPEAACRAGDVELAQWAFEAWEAAANGKLRFERTADREKAHLRLFWSGGRAGLYGEMRPIRVDGVLGGEVYVVPSTESDPLLRDAIVYLTCLHETGHALGLSHTADFADIMYSFQYGGDIAEYFGRYRRQLASRADIHKHSGMSEHDRSRLSAIAR